jgi:homocysteine S-methyltransferase
LEVTLIFLINSGDYGEAGTLEFLKDFHWRRLQVLAGAGPDLIAFETIPNKLEAQVHYFERL